MSEICLCDDLISLKSKQKFQLSFLFVHCYGVDKCDSEDDIKVDDSGNLFLLNSNSLNFVWAIRNKGVHNAFVFSLYRDKSK